MTTSDEPPPIRRCVCGDVTFAALKAAGVRTIEEAEALGAGVSCGLCRTYLQRMLASGETAFNAD